MRGLTIVVAGSDPARFRTALTLAAAQAALGGRAWLFLDAEAVPLMRSIHPAPGDGQPSIADLLETALELGARVTLCQSGLAGCGIDLRELDPRFEAGGITSILSGLGDDRLLAL